MDNAQQGNAVTVEVIPAANGAGQTFQLPQVEHILQFFSFTHLPPFLQEISAPFARLADHVMSLPRNPERTVALRKLLEAKDAAVRAAIAK